jgi:TPR repeat protein
MWKHCLNRPFWLVLFFCAASSAVHADSRDADIDYRLSRLLDGDVVAADRSTIFDEFKQRAVAGDTYSQYVIGSLYRAGEHLPHGFVKGDPDEAARYLSTAAAHGYVIAMAKMAELELARRRSLEAMIWAQLYGHYSGAAKVPAKGATKTAKEDRSKSNDYFADLLHRIYDRFDDARMAEVDRGLNAFVAEHDADVRAGMKANRRRYASSATGPAKKLDLRFQPPPTDLAHARADTLADYVIAFAPDGHAEQAWLLDAVPDMRTGIELKSVALRMQVEADASATGLRYALMPVRLTYRSYSLRNES